MFKVDEDFFDLELDDDFFQDAFNVTSKSTSQTVASTGSEILFKQNDLEHSLALKGSQESLPNEAGNKYEASACVDNSPSEEHSTVSQNKINLPAVQPDKGQLSSSMGSSKHFRSGDCPLTSHRRMPPDHTSLKPSEKEAIAGRVCVDKENDPFPAAGLSSNVSTGNKKKLPFISYDSEDLNSVFNFESLAECSKDNNAVENRTPKSAKNQQHIAKGDTPQEDKFIGNDMPFSVVKHTSPLEKETVALDNSFMHYNNSRLNRTQTVNTVNNKSNRPVHHIQNTPTVHKTISPSNDLLSGVSSNRYLNQGTPRNKSLPVTRKRKFPGPAGILPELPPGADLSALSEPESPVINVSPKDASPQDFVCSQSLVDEFEKQPWQMMKKDVACEGSSTSIMDSYNISWVLQQASTKRLPKGKVPVLCIILKHISFQGSEARVTFADKTGEMSGMIHGKLLEEYQEKLQPGSVLVLKQVTVFSPSSRKHYLVITPSNIISLYGVLGDKTSVVSYNGSELMAMAEEWMQEVTRDSRINALPSNSPCLLRETPLCPRLGLQKSNNSAQQWAGENFSSKQSFTPSRSLLSSENKKHYTAVCGVVTDVSHSTLNSGPCSSRDTMSEMITACNTVIQTSEAGNTSSLDCTEQQPVSLGSSVLKTDDGKEEYEVFEDEFNDILSSLDEEALLSEKW